MAEIVRVRNETRDTILAERAELATSMKARMIGLLGRDHLATGEGLWIQPCNSVHMWFMRFPIDVIFAARDGRVIALEPGLPVWAMTRPHFGAAVALELPVGTIVASGTQPGDRIVQEPPCA